MSYRKKRLFNLYLFVSLTQSCWVLELQRAQTLVRLQGWCRCGLRNIITQSGKTRNTLWRGSTPKTLPRGVPLLFPFEQYISHLLSQSVRAYHLHIRPEQTRSCRSACNSDPVQLLGICPKKTTQNPLCIYVDIFITLIFSLERSEKCLKVDSVGLVKLISHNWVTSSLSEAVGKASWTRKVKGISSQPDSTVEPLSSLLCPTSWSCCHGNRPPAHRFRLNVVNGKPQKDVARTGGHRFFLAPSLPGRKCVMATFLFPKLPFCWVTSPAALWGRFRLRSGNACAWLSPPRSWPPVLTPSNCPHFCKVSLQ